MAWGLNRGLLPALRFLGVDAQGAALPGCGIAAGLPVDADGNLYPQSRACQTGIDALHGEIIDHFQPDVVVWLSTWEMHDRREGGRHLRVGTAAHDAALRADLEATADRFNQAGAVVVILTVVPPPPETLRSVPGDTARYAHYNDLLQELETARAHVRIVDLASFLCPDGPPCPRQLDEVVPRPDGLHISEQGARWLGPQLAIPVLSAAAPTGPT